MSRCAACNKILSNQELVMTDVFSKDRNNDLCRNCQNIVVNPDQSDWIDSDGSDIILFSDQYPFDDDEGDYV